jgi:uncharacterized membrane-anchored protein
MDRTLGLGYGYGSLILICALSVVLLLWRISQESLSVTRVTTRKGEIFVLFTILGALILRTNAMQRAATAP